MGRRTGRHTAHHVTVYCASGVYYVWDGLMVIMMVIDDDNNNDVVSNDDGAQF